MADPTGPLADLIRANAELVAARRAALNLMEDAVLARDALRVSEERQAYLLKLSDTTRPLADPAEVKAAAARVLGEHLGVNRAFYAEVEGDNWMVVRGFEQGAAPLPDGPYSADTYGHWVMGTYRAGERIVFRDTQTDPRFAAPERAAHAAAAIIGAVGVPLMKRGRLVAILTVHTAAPRDWTDAEIALVEETAERTWASVERAKAEAALRRANDDLEARVAERTAELERAFDALEDEMARRREIARRLTTAQEDERSRVARDLHDSVGQLLTGLSLALKAVEASGGLAVPAAARLAEAQRLMSDLGKEVHALAVRLRPTSLDDVGLAGALGNLVAEWKARTGIRTDLHVAGLGRLPAEVETAIYRVAQEALTNVAKHARATLVSVIVTRPDGFVSVVVEDDGLGFDPGAVANGRLGLVGMRERVELVNGQIDIESGSGAGTIIAVQIPIPINDGGT